MRWPAEAVLGSDKGILSVPPGYNSNFHIRLKLSSLSILIHHFSFFTKKFYFQVSKNDGYYEDSNHHSFSYLKLAFIVQCYRTLIYNQ